MTERKKHNVSDQLAGMNDWKRVAWEEIDRAVIQEWIRREEEAIKNIKWKHHMGMDVPPKIS